MKDCQCMYCYGDCCFKPSKVEDGMVAAPCDGCNDEHAEPSADSFRIIV